jgi:2,3-bisphosphoglycerate-dependent phosphoglycerate mutase
MASEKTLLLIARHGNTFDAGEVVRRVGRRSDMPLSTSGQEQAVALGRYLQQRSMCPQSIYTSTLQRTYQTASIARTEGGFSDVPIHELSQFDEIDYGPDEGNPEDDVIRRIGTEALAAWDTDAIVPSGWIVDVQEIIGSWIAFGRHCLQNHAGQTVLLVTSNGIARFAPHITGRFEHYKATLPLKIKTGAICHVSHEADSWQIHAWNVSPAKWLGQSQTAL